MVDAGLRVELSREIVETSVPAYSFREFWQHQLRWARTMRVSRPAGYAGVVLTFSLPWAMLLAAVAPDRWWSWTLFLAALIARLAVSLSIGVEALGDRQMLRDLWLLDGRIYPLSDLPSADLGNCKQKTRPQTQR